MRPTNRERHGRPSAPPRNISTTFPGSHLDPVCDAIQPSRPSLAVPLRPVSPTPTPTTRPHRAYSCPQCHVLLLLGRRVSPRWYGSLILSSPSCPIPRLTISSKALATSCTPMPPVLALFFPLVVFSNLGLSLELQVIAEHLVADKVVTSIIVFAGESRVAKAV